MKFYLFYTIILLNLFCSLFTQDNVNQNNLLTLQNAFPELKFNNPIDLKSSDSDSDDLFVVEKTGKIFVFNNHSNSKSPTLFLDISDKVLNEGECGLLGLAFHPNYKINKYFYVNYTTKKPIKTIIARFQTDSNNPYKAKPESFTQLLEIAQPYANHNGGQVIFGPEGYLYIGMGDGGSGGDPQGHGQNMKSLLGKMLRIDVDQQKTPLLYGIPPSNPYANNKEDICEEIYASGLRNPWRFSFDSKTKKLWCADVGQNKWEEIDIIELGGNYGWNIMEAKHDFKLNPNNKFKLIDPIFEYYHNEGNCSVTGGFVYHGKKIKIIRDHYIYGDYCSKRIWQINSSTFENKLIANAQSSINAFGEDNRGEIFILGANGIIYEFKPNINAPTEFKVIYENNQSIFTWVDNSNNENEFVIERKNANTGKYEVLGKVKADITTFKDKSKMQKTTYRIYAKDADEISAYAQLIKTE